MTARAQSESVGVILLTAVVVVTVSAAGAVVLADAGGDESTRADLSVNVAEEGVALTHNGGDSVAFADLRIVVSHGNETWRPAVNASGIVRGDADDQFERGERWAWRQSLDISEVATVRVFDAATGTLLAADRRYPSGASSLTPTATPEPDTGAPTVALSSPDGGETLLGGSTTTIAWTASDAESGVSRVEISYSIDDGTSWNTVTADTANDGTYRWTVPSVDTTNALVRVTAVDTEANTASESSESTFSIDSTPPTVTLDAPNGGESFDGGETVTVEWTADDAIAGVDSVDIDYSTNGGASWSAVTEGTVNDGSFAWTIPDIDTTDARVRVTATDALGQFATDESDAGFTIEGNASDTPPSVTVEAPNGGEVFRGGSTTTIEWNASDAESSVERVDIEYSVNGGPWQPIAAGLNDTGSYDWSTGEINSTDVRVRVNATDATNNTESATSSRFAIDSDDPEVTFVTPNSSAPTYTQSGQDLTVRWNATDATAGVENVTVRIGNESTTLVDETVSAANGSVALTVPESATAEGNYSVIVEAVDEAGNSGVEKQSDAVVVDDTTPELTLEVEDRGFPFFFWVERYSVGWTTTDGSPHTADVTVYREGVEVDSFSGKTGQESQVFSVSGGQGAQYRFVLNATDRAGNSREIEIDDTSDGSGSYSEQKSGTGDGSAGNEEKGLSNLSVSDLDAGETGQQQSISFTVDGGLAAGETVTIDLSDPQAAKGGGNGRAEKVNYYGATVSGNDDAEFTTQSGDNAVITFTAARDIDDGETVSFDITGVDTRNTGQYTVTFDRSDTNATETVTFDVG
ncbi:hypothetical protein JCM30237_26520 [Halolamina litorea]|uniref:Ig-like domain-containing protein n=1 Tax=Halolamina litorea TaxID=1515593 RepID=A0ABD6BPM6_9EURY|nr:Ig-like domain-containing protein [Halolamina litorea]